MGRFQLGSSAFLPHVNDSIFASAVSERKPSSAPLGTRLLFVLNDAPFFVSHRIAIATAALRAGYEVHVAAPHDSVATPVIRSAGCVVHDLRLDRSGIDAGAELRLLVDLCQLHRRIRPAITHHVTVKPVLLGSLAQRLVGHGVVVNAVPGLGYLYLSRGTMASLRRAALRVLYRVALRRPSSFAIFQNPDDLALFVRLGMVRADHAVLIRGSGVDLEQFPFVKPSDASRTVVLPARMLGDKGVREFVGAARMLRARGVVARCVLVGGLDVNRAAVARSELDAWQSEGIVEWLGRRDDMPEIMRDAAIVCLPSYREGVPKALLEAAATGRPIVTTDVPGCREVVTNGVNGLLVPPRDVPALADALQALLADSALRDRMGRAGRYRAEREFSREDVADVTLALYARGLRAEAERDLNLYQRVKCFL